tara:strand:+ start:2619 stop:2849 length:231 start_codon:yes stop_codon:yes gene_type:complete
MNGTSTLATLGDLKAHGYRLHGFCLPCVKSEDLDLDALIARYGAGRSYLKGLLVLRCSCGAKANDHLLPPMGGGRL